eukprot:scaffold8600_cov111-Cylindrotheca_fusiformis.AAC.9
MMPRRNVGASKAAASPPLPRHSELHQICHEDDNHKTSRSHRMPSFSAKAVIFLRRCLRDSPFTNSMFLFLCMALIFITFTENQNKSAFLRRLMTNSFKAGRGRRYHMTQPRILYIDPFKDYKLQTEKEQATSVRQSGTNNSIIYVSEPAQEAQKLLKNSKKYAAWSRDPLREGDCEPMQWWQETSFPSCNKMHEIHMESQFTFIANGGYNSVFVLNDIDGAQRVVKILQYETDHTDRNFDRVRRDSLIMERASQSPYVVNIFSFCGFAQVVEFGEHGNLDDVTYDYYNDLTSHQKIQIATQVAQGLADVHNIDGDGISSMSHGDYASKQYILIDGRFKLNDFNRGRFIRWNPTLKEPCTYTIGNNDGKFRAPEEYRYVPETAAIDVWALGSIFVELLTGKGVWHGYTVKKAQAKIAAGELPPISSKLLNSTDPVDQVLLKAIDLCYVYEPRDRPKAGVVVDFLKKEAKGLGVDWHAPFVLDVESSS